MELNLENGAKALLWPGAGHITPQGLSFLISKIEDHDFTHLRRPWQGATVFFTEL